MIKPKSLLKAWSAIRPAWRLPAILGFSLVGSVFDATSVFLIYILGTRLSGGVVVQAGVARRGVDALQSVADSWGVDLLAVVSLAFLACILLRGGNKFVLEQTIVRTQFHLNRDYSSRLFKGYFGLPYETFVERNSVERINSMANETGRSGLFIASSLRVAIAAVNLTVLVALLLAVDWHAFLFALLIGVALFLVVRPLTKRSRRVGQRMGSATRDLWFSIFEAMRAYRVVVTNQAVAQVEKDVMHKYDKQKQLQQHNSVTQQLLAPVLEATAGTVVVLAVLASLYLSSRPQDAFPLVILVMSSTYRILPAVTSLNQASTLVQYNEPGLDHVLKELAEVESQQDPPGIKASEPPRHGNHLLEIEDVAFQYRSGRKVLSGVDLHLARGQRIGIVGPSGSGKSTLVDICLGLLRPTAGRVRVGRHLDGQPLKITYLPQQSILLDATVLENITLGLPASQRDPAKAQWSLDQVGLGTGSLHPLNLTDPLGEAGVRLSGGQRQRIGLARCLYRGADLLVLDEPTASLDEASEAGLVSLLEGMQGLTLLMVTHRRAPLRICSKVYRLADGKLHSAKASDLKEDEAGDPTPFDGLADPALAGV